MSVSGPLGVLFIFSIDGTFSKTKGKFVNDAVGSEKNSTMLLITVKDTPHLCLFATKHIKTGTEIRYDYGVSNLPWRKKVWPKHLRVTLSSSFLQAMFYGLYCSEYRSVFEWKLVV